MKKILSILILCTLFSVCRAQSSFTHTASNPTGTVTNTSLDTMSYTTSASYQHVSIQPLYTKTSGTMAGTGRLYKSVNGSTWMATGDTVIIANAATSGPTVWEVSSSARYWRVITTGSGTTVYVTACKISAAN